MTLRSGASVVFIDVRQIERRQPREKCLGLRPLRMRRPAARVIARASEIARVRACVNSWRTFSDTAPHAVARIVDGPDGMSRVDRPRSAPPRRGDRF